MNNHKLLSLTVIVGLSLLSLFGGFIVLVQAVSAHHLRPMTITAASQVPPQVTIDGPVLGITGTTYAFTATVSPPATTTPLTYTWQATAQTDVVTTTGCLEPYSFLHLAHHRYPNHYRHRHQRRRYSQRYVCYRYWHTCCRPKLPNNLCTK